MNLLALFRRQTSSLATPERLQVLLAHERSAIELSRLPEVLREEILGVIAKHINIDRANLNIRLDRGDEDLRLEIDVKMSLPAHRNDDVDEPKSAHKEHGAGERNDIALQHQAARDLEADLARAAGGLLRADDVEERLANHVGRRPSVNVKMATVPDRLLGLNVEGERLFPACQFEGSRVLNGISEVLEAAPSTDGWRVLQFLLGTPDGLNGHRPIDLLRNGGPADRARVIAFAHTLED